MQIFEHEVNSLDDDGQLSQSSTRLRDDISVSSKCSSHLLESNRSSSTRTEKSTQVVQNNKNEVKALLPLPPIPPRTKPSLFLPTNSNTQPLLSKFLRTSQTFSAKKAKANQQLDTSTNPFNFDTIQTDELNTNASGEITLFPTKQPIDVLFEVDITSSKMFDLPKTQLSTAASTTFDTKQHITNIQNTKQNAEIISGYSKNNVEPNITKRQKTSAEENYLETYQFGNEISIQNKPYNQFPIPNIIDNMSTFTTISPSVIQQVKRPYEQPQDPFLEIQAQQTDQVLLKNCETQIGLESSTTQNQLELQDLSATRDNISGKQTMPVFVRPKTKIHEPRINLENLTLMYKVSKSKCVKFKPRMYSKPQRVQERFTIIGFFLVLWQKLRLLHK